MTTDEKRKSIENLLFQSGHAGECPCTPCRLIRWMMGQSQESIHPCQFEGCDNAALCSTGEKLRLCAGHRCPIHSEYGSEEPRQQGVCPPPCPWNCGCNCSTCAGAREQRVDLGHRDDCGCTDCGCEGDQHGDCGIRCRG